MSGNLLIRDLSKYFGGVAAADHVTMDFASGSLSAIIGPNGAGKTTLFNLITGHVRPSSGDVNLDGDTLVGRSPREIVRLGVGRAFQVASLFATFTVEEAIAAAVLSHERRLFNMVDEFPTPASRERAEWLMEVTDISRIARLECSVLAHGDQKLLDIALAVTLQPKVLLLDEPTAGMGSDESRVMIDRIYRLWESQKMTVIFIEHDMDIVFNIAQSVRVLQNGAVLAQGTPDEIRRHPQVIEAYLGSEM